MAVRYFEPFIVDCHVLIRTDNTVMRCYVINGAAQPPVFWTVGLVS